MIKISASGKLTRPMKDEEELDSCQSGDEPREQTQVALVADLDYYLENGLMVFTAHYLLRRGYCCDNGCRHCPYEEQGERRRVKSES